MAAEDQGRRRIAQLIHDDSLQTLLAANQDLIEAAPGRAQVQRAHEVVEAAIARLREAMLALHPVTLEQGGLEQAVGAVARQAARQGAFEIELRLDPEALGREDELVLAVSRELLTNAARHSGATKVSALAGRHGRRRRARDRRRRPRDRVRAPGRGARGGSHRPRLGQRARAGGRRPVRALHLAGGNPGGRPPADRADRTTELGPQGLRERGSDPGPDPAPGPRADRPAGRRADPSEASSWAAGRPETARPPAAAMRSSPSAAAGSSPSSAR